MQGADRSVAEHPFALQLLYSSPGSQTTSVPQNDFLYINQGYFTPTIFPTLPVDPYHELGSLRGISELYYSETYARTIGREPLKL